MATFTQGFTPNYSQINNYPMPALPTQIISQMSNETTLYVCNLSPTTNESNLRMIFEPYGQVSSTKIMRDVYTSVSRRFGFVSFATVEEAEKARENLNYEKIDGFEIRICFKKIASEFKEVANLFIKNINPSISIKKVDALFSQFGKIVSCSIRTNDKGESLKYGYIQYESEESANEAREKLNGSTQFGQIINVEKFVSSKNRETIKNNIYLKNFPKSWSIEKCKTEVNTMFTQIGTVICSDVREKKFQDDKIAFYGFCAFESPESAKLAIEKYKNAQLEGWQEGEDLFYVDFVDPKSSRMLRLRKEFSNVRNTTNLYVKTIIESVSDETIREVFSKYGVITSMATRITQPKFMPNGQSVKSAFINFKTGVMATDVLLNAKKDPNIKALIHPIHNQKVEFVVYFQNKAAREDYNRMKMRLYQSWYFGMNNNFPPPMMNSFKKNQAYNQNNFQYLPPIYPQGMGQFMAPGRPMRNDRNMPGIHSGTPPTGKNLPSSSTSRQGEDEEVFNLDYLKNHKNEFLGFDKDRQNNILGNLMYHKVMESGLLNKELAPKITGMLIDLDILEIAEIIEIMENRESLNERVNEALEVINTNED